MSEKPSSFEILKDLLLREERQQSDDAFSEIEGVRQEVTVRKKLEQNMEPILVDWFMRFRRDFPKEFGHLFYQTLEKEVEENPERIQEALRPIFHELISDYFSNRVGNIKNKLGFGRVNKLKDPTKLYREKIEPKQKNDVRVKLSDVFVLENENRSLIGMLSEYASDNNEVTSLMLDTIRRMVEDAVLRQGQSIDWVDFNGYKIYLISFKRISIACTVTGQPSQTYMNTLEDKVMDFAKEMLPEMHDGDFDYNARLANKLLVRNFDEIRKK
jgi:hypothetical protein